MAESNDLTLVAVQIQKAAPTSAPLSSLPSPPNSELISHHIPLFISGFIRPRPSFILIISSANLMYAWQFFTLRLTVSGFK